MVIKLIKARYEAQDKVSSGFQCKNTNLQMFKREEKKTKGNKRKNCKEKEKRKNRYPVI